MKEIINKRGHKYWNAIGARLYNTLMTKGCDHSLDITEQILRSLPGVGVGGTLDVFLANGGFCDCEVLYNVIGGKGRLRKPE